MGVTSRTARRCNPSVVGRAASDAIRSPATRKKSGRIWSSQVSGKSHGAASSVLTAEPSGVMVQARPWPRMTSARASAFTPSLTRSRPAEAASTRVLSDDMTLTLALFSG